MQRFGFVFIVLLALTGFSQPGMAASETITIVADKWCPYNCAEKDTNQGYMVEIARKALGKYGINVVYKVMPWGQAVEMTRQGKYDAVVGANRGDAPDFIFPEVVQGISISLAWVKADSTWEYKDLASLDGVRVGIIDGYSYGKAIDPYLKKRRNSADGKIRILNTDDATERNIEDLIAGKIDVILEDKTVIEYYFASRDLPITLRPAGNPVDLHNVDDTYLYVAFGPNKPAAKHYADLLKRGMQEMRQNGELKAILARYNISDSYRFTRTPKIP